MHRGSTVSSQSSIPPLLPLPLFIIISSHSGWVASSRGPGVSRHNPPTLFEHRIRGGGRRTHPRPVGLGGNDCHSQHFVGNGTQCRHASGRLNSFHTFAPLPVKLVKKIKGGQFVDLKELLHVADNIVLQRQIEAVQPQLQQVCALSGQSCPHLRELATLGAWIYAFFAITVRAPDPQTRNLLTYVWLILRVTEAKGGWNNTAGFDHLPGARSSCCI